MGNSGKHCKFEVSWAISFQMVDIYQIPRVNTNCDNAAPPTVKMKLHLCVKMKLCLQGAVNLDTEWIAQCK